MNIINFPWLNQDEFVTENSHLLKVSISHSFHSCETDLTMFLQKTSLKYQARTKKGLLQYLQSLGLLTILCVFLTLRFHRSCRWKWPLYRSVSEHLTSILVVFSKTTTWFDDSYFIVLTLQHTENRPIQMSSACWQRPA